MGKILFSENLKDSSNIAKEFAAKIFKTKRIKAKKHAVVIALIGELGSGKTTFAQSFAEALGVKEKIKSPTFIIFRKSKIPLATPFKYFYHFDVYRIHNEKEILNLGWEEIISNPQNIVLIEWADKIKKILPKDTIKINFRHKGKDERSIIIS